MLFAVRMSRIFYNDKITYITFFNKVRCNKSYLSYIVYVFIKLYFPWSFMLIFALVLSVIELAIKHF